MGIEESFLRVAGQFLLYVGLGCLIGWVAWFYLTVFTLKKVIVIRRPFQTFTLLSITVLSAVGLVCSIVETLMLTKSHHADLLLITLLSACGVIYLFVKISTAASLKRIELARAYILMGKKRAAKELLDEVFRNGSLNERQAAKDLIGKVR